MQKRITALALLLAAVLVRPGVPRAENDPEVVRVGSQSLRVSDVEGRLAAMPVFQLRTLGDNPAEVRRRFVDTVLVPELLATEEAGRRRLAEEPGVRSRILETRRTALSQALSQELEQKQPVTDAEVAAHYESKRSQFETPERIQIWRILTEDDATARRVIAESRGVGGPERWRALAREVSQDQATRMRDGNLGFVMPDGRTTISQVRVDPAVFKAAQGVRDGEIVTKPVKEGNRYAVIWRRGSLPALNRSLETEAPAIRQLLARQRLDERLKQLLADLRKRNLRDYDAAPLAQLPTEAPLPAWSGSPRDARRPPTMPSGSPREARRPPRPSTSGAAPFRPGDPVPHQGDPGRR